MTNFFNTLDFAKQLDQQDVLHAYRNKFHIPQHNGSDMVYFTGNSLGLQPKTTKDYLQQELNDWAKLKEQELQAKKAAMAEKIHQMDHKLKVDFQLLEHRLAHHRECLETLVRNIKKAPVSE